MCWKTTKRKCEKKREKQIKSDKYAASPPLFMWTGQLPDIGMRERQEVRGEEDRGMRLN